MLTKTMESFEMDKAPSDDRSKKELGYLYQIMSCTKECFDYILDPSSNKLENTSAAVASIFMGKNHPYILFEEKYIPIYTIWIFAVTKKNGWSVKHKDELWKHLKRGYFLYVNSPETSKSERLKIKEFHGLFTWRFK
jgi:hypothetical protein